MNVRFRWGCGLLLLMWTGVTPACGEEPCETMVRMVDTCRSRSTDTHKSAFQRRVGLCREAAERFADVREELACVAAASDDCVRFMRCQKDVKIGHLMRDIQELLNTGKSPTAKRWCAFFGVHIKREPKLRHLCDPVVGEPPAAESATKKP
jgi:hypothetical protein